MDPNATAIADPANAIPTSQFALPEEACSTVYASPSYTGSAQNLARVSLATDNVFGDDGGSLQVATITGDATNGYRATLSVRVDTPTPASGGAPGGGPDRATRP